MFCDLVGSTELSARLDPEDLREVIAAYHRAVAEVVKRFDGFRRKIYGRWRVGLFRLPQSARG
jgi:class 3 adenylate cyclase